MHCEHSVEWRSGATQVRQTRELFTTRDGRILGTETIRHTQHVAWSGPSWREDPPSTFHFLRESDARAWMDAMFRDHDVALATGARSSDLLYPVAS
jgi:hypothetical protein